jgi:hypothetical protein
MPDQKKSSTMLPVIVIGAALFGFGAYQSMKPKEFEVNKGFEAPPAVSAPNSPSVPDTPSADTSGMTNPRTMQAPDAPPMTKDAAQLAAEADDTTKIEAKVNGKSVKLSISDAPWLQGIMSGALGNFREGVLASLKTEQTKGDINCTPVLTSMTKSAFSGVEKVTCTAKDGGQISAEFDETGDGDLTIEDTNGGSVKVSKNDGDFNVETRNSQ